MADASWPKPPSNSTDKRLKGYNGYMHYHPKLILLNGPVGIGKSTIAQRYVNDHPLSLALNGDDIIVMLGQWLTHEDLARERVFELTKSMMATHLEAGYSVIAPYLVTNPAHAAAFEQVAVKHKARFYEVVLMASSKEEAIARAFERGTWGEKGTDPLADADRHILDDIYNRMLAALAQRPHTVEIRVKKGDPDNTYTQLMGLFD
jgi:predicted kinase